MLKYLNLLNISSVDRVGLLQYPQVPPKDGTWPTEMKNADPFPRNRLV